MNKVDDESIVATLMHQPTCAYAQSRAWVAAGRPEADRLLAQSDGYRVFDSWGLRLTLLQQAARGVAHMHAHNIIHRDLTSYNMLVADHPSGSGPNLTAKVDGSST